MMCAMGQTNNTRLKRQRHVMPAFVAAALIHMKFIRTTGNK
jgi:hypothetical protein